jgi:hypothetical protein
MTRQRRPKSGQSSKLDNHRQSAPPEAPAPAPTAPTPESAKAIVDSFDHAGQFAFFVLCLQDQRSRFGGMLRGMLACERQRIEHLEKLAGIALGDIDPEELLTTKETLREASERLGKNENAIKQARHRARQRMQKLLSIPPSSVLLDDIEITVKQKPTA